MALSDAVLSAVDGTNAMTHLRATLAAIQRDERYLDVTRQGSGDT